MSTTTAKKKSAKDAPKSDSVATELQESFFSQPVVDEENGVIRNVKLLGTKSANNRVYLESAIKDAIGMYEGAGIYADHPTAQKATESRSFRDKFAWVQGVKQDENGGLTGDVHCLMSDENGRKLIESAKKNPKMFGMSHNISGRTRVKEGGAVEVYKIEAVHSVDAVTDPATTRSLFEQVEAASTDASDENETTTATESTGPESENETAAETVASVGEEGTEAAPATESVASDSSEVATRITESVKASLKSEIEILLKPLQDAISKLAESLEAAKASPTQPTAKAKPAINTARDVQEQKSQEPPRYADPKRLAEAISGRR